MPVNLINNILTTGVFPIELKIAKVMMLHIKGPEADMNNYRPISLLNTMSKVVEKIIKKHIIAYVNATFKFDGLEYGFQPFSGTLPMHQWTS